MLLYVPFASAQTTVNLSVTDTPDNQTWNNGTYSVTLQATPGSNVVGPFSVTSGGGSVASQSGSLSATGTASFSLPANVNVSPFGTQWGVTVCSQATWGCFTQRVTITTSSPQTVALTPPSIRINFANTTPPIAAYTDTEVTGAVLGSVYYNIIALGNKTCTALTGASCTTWSVPSGAGIKVVTTNGYTVVSSDKEKRLSLQNLAAQTITFPPVGGSFLNQWCVNIGVDGTGNASWTISATPTTVLGLGSSTLQVNQSARICSSGASWYADTGQGGGSPAAGAANTVQKAGAGGALAAAAISDDGTTINLNEQTNVNAGGASNLLSCANGADPGSFAVGNEYFWCSADGRIVVNENATTRTPIDKLLCDNVTPVTSSGGAVTTDQNLMACTVPAGILNITATPGREIEIFAAGVYSIPAATTPTITVKVKLCSVSGCGSGNVTTLANITTTASVASITNNPFNFSGYAATQTGGATSAFEAHGTLNIDLSAAVTAAVSTFLDTNTATVTGTPAALDITAQTFLQITISFSVANAGNVATQRHLSVRISG